VGEDPLLSAEANAGHVGRGRVPGGRSGYIVVSLARCPARGSDEGRTAVIGVNDDELLAELREVFAEVDPIDPTLLEQARLAYTWRTIDADLAELAYDSVADREVMAAVRDDGLSGSGPRLLGFGTDLTGEDADALSVEVEVTTERGRTEVVGQILPPGPATVRLLRAAGRGAAEAAVTADDLGCFRIAPVPVGPVRLRIELGDRKVETSWVTYTNETPLHRRDHRMR